MRTIRIILSLDQSLQQERLELSDLIESLNHALENHGTKVLMQVSVFSTHTDSTDSSIYKDEVKKADLCLTLYLDTINDAIRSELETAYQSLCEGGNPKKIYVYFKDCAPQSEEMREYRDRFPDDYGHFYCSFSNADTLKADFLLQFMGYMGESFDKSKILEVHDGMVFLDGVGCIELKNIPFACNNEEYLLLLRKEKETQQILTCTDKESPFYVDLVKDLTAIKERIAKVEQGLWKTASKITEMMGVRFSERLSLAVELFNNGRMEEALRALDEEEIDKDIQRCSQFIDKSLDSITDLIREYELH